MAPRKRKPKSGKPPTRPSPQKPRVTKKAKSSSRKSRSKLPRKVTAVRPLPAQPEEILFRVEGKMSTFGGPHDLGMAANEDLALFTKADLQDPKYAYLFLPASPPGTSGLGRRLNPDRYYFACRWNYANTPKEFLRRALARVEAGGSAVGLEYAHVLGKERIQGALQVRGRHRADRKRRRTNSGAWPG